MLKQKFWRIKKKNIFWKTQHLGLGWYPLVFLFSTAVGSPHKLAECTVICFYTGILSSHFMLRVPTPKSLVVVTINWKKNQIKIQRNATTMYFKRRKCHAYKKSGKFLRNLYPTFSLLKFLFFIFVRLLICTTFLRIIFLISIFSVW